MSMFNMFGSNNSNSVNAGAATQQADDSKASTNQATPSQEDLDLESSLKESKQVVDFSSFLSNNKNISENEQNKSSQPSQPSAEDQKRAMEDFFNSKQFNAVTSDLYSKLQEGDVDSFNEALSNSFRSVYKDAMISAGKMIDAKFASIDEMIASRLESHSKSASLMSAIKGRIPLAQNPKFSSMIVNQVKENMAMGMKEAEAISAVRSLFSDMQNELTPKSEKARTVDEFDSLFK